MPVENAKPVETPMPVENAKPVEILKPVKNAVRTRIAVALLACLTLGIAFGTLMPSGMQPPVPGGDKTHHLLGFAALTLPVVALRPGWFWPVLAFAVAYGGAIEIVQPYVGRSREMADWLADIAGAAIGAGAGLLIAWIWAAFRRRGA
ncbi:VanZ family protein [Gemmobacter serpentinus]|uniref:VanZ family protein n=1 Tax=Gemmobacter serpentinus TaxID=2652247 RepID=UPI001CF61CBA|nr:VanZ family protein [Gemmobacter serpentinus]